MVVQTILLRKGTLTPLTNVLTDVLVQVLVAFTVVLAGKVFTAVRPFALERLAMITKMSWSIMLAIPAHLTNRKTNFST